MTEMMNASSHSSTSLWPTMTALARPVGVQPNLVKLTASVHPAVRTCIHISPP